jgi:hypothetical protein
MEVWNGGEGMGRIHSSTETGAEEEPLFFLELWMKERRNMEEEIKHLEPTRQTRSSA